MKNEQNMIGKKFIFSAALIISIGHIATLAPSAFAQGATISTNAMERSHFYKAPREYQIIDERPVIRDFREPAVKPGQIGLPNGPGAYAGGPGAGGLGDLGGGGTGANSTLPADGLQIPGGSQPAYRDDPTGISTLPKSGFGGSNIPARGLGPRGILPSVTTGVVGKLMSQPKRIKPQTAPAKAFPQILAGAGKPSGAPVVASYGGYGNNPTSYGNGLNASKTVRGYLLKANK